MPFITTPKKIKIAIGAILLMCVLGVGCRLVYTSTFASFSDNVLRPVIGSKNVLALETFFFNAMDSVNQIVYTFKKPSVPEFSDVASTIVTPTPQVLAQHDVSLVPVHQLDLTPLTSPRYFSPLPNEGVWQPMNLSLFPDQTVAATTFIRPDPERSYAIVDVLKMDITKMRMGLVAGTEFPGGPLGNYGPGVVPKDIQDSNMLIAAFSGGFQYKDGQYGMIVGDKTYVPMKKNAATLLIHKSGKIEIVNYTGQDLGNDLVGIRQNCPMLVSNGQVTAETSLGEYTWGWTDVQSNMYTIRTGIGITQDGDLLFAVGKALVPKTLGEALKDAGAVNAMQLDINPSWTRFILYHPLGNGKYTYESYDKDLINGGKAYLQGWNKDFIYLYKAPDVSSQ